MVGADIVDLHFADERKLYSKLGGCPFDIKLLDIGKDEESKLAMEVSN